MTTCTQKSIGGGQVLRGPELKSFPQFWTALMSCCLPTSGPQKRLGSNYYFRKLGIGFSIVKKPITTSAWKHLALLVGWKVLTLPQKMGFTTLTIRLLRERLELKTSVLRPRLGEIAR